MKMNGSVIDAIGKIQLILKMNIHITVHIQVAILEIHL